MFDTHPVRAGKLIEIYWNLMPNHLNDAFSREYTLQDCIIYGMDIEHHYIII